jgi:hypothetical protein
MVLMSTVRPVPSKMATFSLIAMSVAGSATSKVLLERQCQIVGLGEPPRMERKSQIVNAGCIDRGPLVHRGVSVFVGLRPHSELMSTPTCGDGVKHVTGVITLMIKRPGDGPSPREIGVSS